ncbi:MAG: hypothetical protein OEV30_12705, partial [Ignavibacteria bacterium]|nr:hypothetical protein [Ignavibacteria bacterium]
GWTVSDLTRAGFSSDTPPDGGLWSASMITASGTPVYAQTTVPTTPGNQVYKLTVWSKKTVIDGAAALILKRETGAESSSSVPINVVGWQTYTLFDTLSTLPGDSVIVRLSGGRSIQPTGSVLFDLCLLEQL